MLPNRIVPTQIRVEQQGGIHRISIKYERSWFVVCEVNNMMMVTEVRRSLEEGTYSQKALLKLCYAPPPRFPPIKKTSSPYDKVSVKKAVLQILKNREGVPITSNQLSALINVTSNAITQCMHRLVLRDEVERVGLHDKYAYVTLGTLKRSNNIEEYILNLIRNNPGISRRTVFAKMDVHIPHEAPLVLNRMKKNNVLRCDSKGRYYATN